jgi:HrpA-like RNA helicase
MLVFLTGRDEIETAVRRTRELVKSLVGCDKRLRAMPLYAAMNSNSQMKVFQSIKAPVCLVIFWIIDIVIYFQNTRKVIYATNIAETSLTIPGIRIVIDSGKVKMR